jgi:meso-butanediol dehydrogenase/(S,S)-butanediol dehydrogenase/diacetyl reductase
MGQSYEDYLQDIRDRVPLGRVGQVEDVAKMCAYLASEEAEYVTGEAINVSGGEEMH